MPSPRRRRLKRALRLAALKAQEVVESVVEKVAPKEEEAPVVVEKPVVKEQSKPAPAPKKAPAKAKKAAKNDK